MYLHIHSFIHSFFYLADDDEESVSLNSLLFPIAGSVLTIIIIIVIAISFIVSHRKKLRRTPKDTESKILKQKLHQEKRRAMNTSLVYTTTNKPIFASVTQQEENEIAQEIRECYKNISDTVNRPILCCPDEKTTYAYQPASASKKNSEANFTILRPISNVDGVELMKSATSFSSSVGIKPPMSSAHHCVAANDCDFDDDEDLEEDFESDSLLSFSQKENDFYKYESEENLGYFDNKKRKDLVKPKRSQQLIPASVIAHSHRSMRVSSWIDESSDNSNDGEKKRCRHRRENESESNENENEHNLGNIKDDNESTKTTNTLFELVCYDDDVDSILTSVSRMDARRMDRLKDTEFYKRLSSKSTKEKDFEEKKSPFTSNDDKGTDGAGYYKDLHADALNLHGHNKENKNTRLSMSNDKKTSEATRLNLSLDSIDTDDGCNRYLDPSESSAQRKQKTAKRSLSHEEILSISSREDNDPDCCNSASGSEDYERELAEWDTISLSRKKNNKSIKEKMNVQKPLQYVNEWDTVSKQHRYNSKDKMSLRKPVQYIDKADRSESFFKIVRPALLNPDEFSESGHTFSENFKRSHHRQIRDGEGSGFEESSLTSTNMYSYDRKRQFIIIDDKNTGSSKTSDGIRYLTAKTKDSACEGLGEFDVLESSSFKHSHMTDTSKETLNDEDYEELAANLSYDDESLSLTVISTENDVTNTNTTARSVAAVSSSRTFENILRELKIDRERSDLLPRSYIDKKPSTSLMTTVKRYAKPKFLDYEDDITTNSILVSTESTGSSSLNIEYLSGFGNDGGMNFVSKPKSSSITSYSSSSSTLSGSPSISRSQSTTEILANNRAAARTTPSTKFKSMRGNLSAYISSRQSVSKSSANATSTTTCHRMLNRSMSSPKLSSTSLMAQKKLNQSPPRKMFHLSARNLTTGTSR